MMLLLSTGAIAQYSISGTVRQEESMIALSGATIQVGSTDRFTVTDSVGRFSLENMPGGKIQLLAKFLGHADKVIDVNLDRDLRIDILLKEVPMITEAVIVEGTRAAETTPTTFTTVNKQELTSRNFGQDLPYLLNWTPSLVTTSDAGTGIGYTGLRIRGSDATRINVTINGIPYNDSESLGTFWVDVPDIASSAQSIQVQRGVGTSTNGAAAFGGTVNLQTDTQRNDSFAEVTASIGSFSTTRYSITAGSGLLNNHWSFTGRLSKIKSDGYVDRASSDLGSYFLSGTYHGDKSIWKALVFGGKEVTYQSWYGIDAEQMKIRRTFNYAGAIYDDNGTVSGYYDNQTDNYKQDHGQIHFSSALTEKTNLTIGIHYTYGRGYYEEYNQGIPFEFLGLNNVILKDTTISEGDFITRKWLDNHFYGTTFALTHELQKLSVVIGGGYHRYAPAHHYGEILWSTFAVNLVPRQRYYEGGSEKNDLNVYTKFNYDLMDKLRAFIDLQYRTVDYETSGLDDSQIQYNISDRLNFFNPKAGLSYSIDPENMLYVSYAVAHREPSRTDYLENNTKPRPEQLGNLEAGWRRKAKEYALELNYYLMNYRDQLVLTGELDNVGNPIRQNVGKSYRTGIEVSGSISFSSRFSWTINATWSRNRNIDFIWEDETNLTRKANTPIILSPDWIAASQLAWKAGEGFQAILMTKYVSRQYLDNTHNEGLVLNSYLVNDLSVSRAFPVKGTEGIEFSLLINNLFDARYASNGYSYDGVPYYYPQAGINFLFKTMLKL